MKCKHCVIKSQFYEIELKKNSLIKIILKHIKTIWLIYLRLLKVSTNLYSHSNLRFSFIMSQLVENLILIINIKKL